MASPRGELGPPLPGVPKDLAINEACRAGLAIARAEFERRGNHSEAHLSEHQLALLLARAFQAGVQHGKNEGRHE